MTRSYILKVHSDQDLLAQLRTIEEDDYAIRIVQRLGGVASAHGDYEKWLVVVESTRLSPS